ncbi:hypothetical protein ABZT27_31445 [Streptomyces sp. NPDC005389]|uniref:hypothetical protein n=1 Tax=Streptomyces sp. NPDC005389 TaxID=3157040 RepID=UPI0033B8E609
MSPALERALVRTHAGPLVLLDGYRPPGAIRHLGIARLTRWLAQTNGRLDDGYYLAHPRVPAVRGGPAARCPYARSSSCGRVRCCSTSASRP